MSIGVVRRLFKVLAWAAFLVFAPYVVGIIADALIPFPSGSLIGRWAIGLATTAGFCGVLAILLMVISYIKDGD